jgi:hypothetical protein
MAFNFLRCTLPLRLELLKNVHLYKNSTYSVNGRRLSYRLLCIKARRSMCTYNKKCDKYDKNAGKGPVTQFAEEETQSSALTGSRLRRISSHSCKSQKWEIIWNELLKVNCFT